MYSTHRWCTQINTKLTKIHTRLHGDGSQVVPKYKLGEKVMIKCIGKAGMLEKRYFGPAEVTRVIDKKSYELRLGNKVYRRHEDMLKMYKGREEVASRYSCQATSYNETTILRRGVRQTKAVDRYGFR